MLRPLLAAAVLLALGYVAGLATLDRSTPLTCALHGGRLETVQIFDVYPQGLKPKTIAERIDPECVPRDEAAAEDADHEVTPT